MMKPMMGLLTPNMVSNLEGLGLMPYDRPYPRIPLRIKLGLCPFQDPASEHPMAYCLSLLWCDRGDDGTGAQRWALTAVTNNVGVYDVVNVARANCNGYLSCTLCDTNLADLFTYDDGSGRQQWRFVHA